MLSFAEEIYLLSLDDTTGKIALSGGSAALHRAIVGAVLCELAVITRIDVDVDYLYAVDPTPTNEPMLDYIFDIIVRKSQPETTHYWLERLLSEASRLEKIVAEGLVKKGILKVIESRVLWVFPSRRYPLIDNEEVDDVERRLRDLITNDEIPCPRDAVLFCLAYACDLLHEILSPKELQRYHERIESLSKMDLLGQEIIRAISELPMLTTMPQQAF